MISSTSANARAAQTALFTLTLAALAAAQAKADIGLPMLAVVWPCSWLLLFVIIPLEAWVARRLFRQGLKASLKMAGAANLLSTLAGIPLTWIALVVLQMLAGGGRERGLETSWLKLYAVTVQSPWLIPYESDFYWMIPCAVIVLCIPFFFMSVGCEYLAARRFAVPVERPNVLRWAWQANGVSYGGIVLLLLAQLLFALHQHGK